MSTNILEYDKATFHCLIMRTTLSVLTLNQTKEVVDEFFFNKTLQFRSDVYNYIYKIANGQTGTSVGQIEVLIGLWELVKFILENTPSNIMDDEIYRPLMDDTQTNVENGNLNEMQWLDTCSGIKYSREHDEMIRKIGNCNITGDYVETTNIMHIIFTRI